MLRLRPTPLHCTFLAAALLSAAFASPAAAERPDAPHLLPDSTLAYVRVTNTRDLISNFQQTALGRMLQDESIRPLFKQLYGSAAEGFAQIQDQVGAALDEILSIPQGELLAFAMPQDSPPTAVAIIETGDQMRAAQKLLDRGEQELAKQGAIKSFRRSGRRKW